MSSALAPSLNEELTDAVFRAALEPDAWQDIMALMKLRFPSEVLSLYFLHLQTRQIEPVVLMGTTNRWLSCFDQFYFAPDNPWIKLTKQLHLPGVVRTNERLADFLGDPLALYRSSYYNEWLRPQGVKYSLGNTLYSDGSLVSNITLLRSSDMKTFDEAEVQAFESLSRDVTRSMQISVRLQQAEAGPGSIRAFDRLPHAVALVDARLKVMYANLAMEALTRDSQGLTIAHGTLRASSPDFQQQLALRVGAAVLPTSLNAQQTSPMVLKLGPQTRVEIYVVPVAGPIQAQLPRRPTALLMAIGLRDEQRPSRVDLRARYALTDSEARLLHLLVAGCALREAAPKLGITYGTARGYLKVVFEKLNVHRQSELVARVLQDNVGESTASLR